MKQVPLAEIKDDFSRLLREASKEELVITRHGKPAGILVGFASEEDWIDHNIENNPEFLERIANARTALERGEGVLLSEYKKQTPPASRTEDIAIIFDTRGRAYFTTANLQQATALVLERLKTRLAPKKISAGRVFSSTNTVQTPFYRIRRAKTDFAADLELTLGKMVDFFAKAMPKNWPSSVLELGYSDKKEFQSNGENVFREYVYLFARLVKTKS